MPTPPSERNLLFAVLALQNELTKPDEVLAAMHVWVAAKHRSLGEILVERGALDPCDRQLLDALIERQLARQGNVERSLAALDPSSRARQVLAKIADPEVQASLAALPAASVPDQTAVYQPAEAGPRYRVLRPHARGGLGEVFVAEDEELHREVALKEIRPDHAGHPESRSRFVLEAEITGGLEHPGIVPVYGLGTYGDGRPFYAMRFIKGDNLEAAIARFHATPPAKFDSLEFRQLLGRFVDVCQAVAYAHSRGVLHRDLKPGNIMLGKFGETLVVDWGLAKVIGRSGEGQAAAQHEATLRPSSGSGRAETALGTAIGTPAFMSPEQASGKLDELGPATDVYSLGATLYVLLTNRRPYQGEVAEIMEHARQGDFTPPRQSNPSLPPALDAICRKAMALKPEDRYSSAMALADDVEHWLADEPVTAYAEPSSVRLRRWLRKHPKRVTAVGVLLVATVVSLTIGAVLIDEQRRVAKEGWDEADKMFHEATNAVDTFFTKVSEEQLSDLPGVEALQRKLLMQALEYYEGFIKERADDPAVRRELARAYFRASSINSSFGLRTQSQAQATQAVALYQELLAKSPDNRELRAELAGSYRALTSAQFEAGEHDAALASASRRIELLEPLWAEQPSDGKVGRELAEAYSGRVLQWSQLGKMEEAAGDTRRAADILEKKLPTLPAEEKEHAEGILGYVYFRSGELPRCLKAIDVFRRLKTYGLDFPGVSLHPEHLPGGLESNPIRWALRGALSNAANNFINIGQPGKAEPLLRESEGIIRKHPMSRALPTYIAHVLGSLGESLFFQRKAQAAAKLLQEATDQRVVSGGLGIEDHAWYTYLLGRIKGEAGGFDKGLDHCELALREQQGLLAPDRGMGKDNPIVENSILWTRETIANFRFQAGKIALEERLAEQRRILVDRKRLSSRAPKSGWFQGQFESEASASAAVLAGLLLEAGRAGEALDVVNEVLPSQERLVESDKPDSKDFPGYDFRNYVLRQVLAELLARKGEALAGTGKAADAAKVLHRAIEICEEIAKPEPCYLYDLAHHLTLASTLPGKEGGPALADRALKALRDVIAAGFDNPYKLRHDPRLEPLRKRDDFQKLVRDLEGKVNQAKAP